MTTIRKPIFIIPHDLGEISSGNVLAGHSASSLNRHSAIGLTWRTDGNSSVWVRGQFAAEKTVDFCAMISANALAGTQIRLRLGDTQAEVDGGSAPYDSAAQDFIDPSITRDDGLYHSHLELNSPVDCLWWRVDITGHTGDFEAASLVLGEAIEPGRFYNYDFEYGIEDLGSLEITRFGVFNEEPGIILRTIQFTLAWQTEAEFEASFRPMMERLGTRGVVYCCFDPEATTYRQARTYMGIFRKPPFATGQRKPRTFSQEFVIHSLI